MNKDEYENLTFENDFQVEQLKLAFSIVKKFIQFNKRIMFGGMAIDHALRLKNDKLYPDNKLPDYDFLSPVFHIDAYTLGEELVSNGLSGVSVIRGQHISTMKVRLNFVDVADIGYIPQKIYDKIPTIIYDGILNVHPSFQYIDQHRALSVPFENPPRESFLNRWEKDIKRFTLLNKYYKINQELLGNKDELLGDIEDKEVIYSLKKVIDIMPKICLGGMPALAYWLEIAKDHGFKNDINNTTKDIFKCEILKNDYNFSIPMNYNFTILSKDNISKKSFIGNKKYYNAILDKLPKKTIINSEDETYEIFNTQNILISAHKVKIGLNEKVYIANLQHIMCYLLTMHFMETEQDKTNYLYYYIIAYDLLIYMSEKYSETKDKKTLEELALFLPTVEVYGNKNISDSYDIYLQMTLHQVDNEKFVIDAPRDAFPSYKKKINPEFYNYNPAKSEFYQIDGEEKCEE
jgi:hypothetical protein